MIKKTYFTGTGFDLATAIESANTKADEFISSGNDRREEIARAIINTNYNQNFFTATLELTYKTK